MSVSFSSGISLGTGISVISVVSAGGGSVSINPTFASAPYRTSYQFTPKTLNLWYASPSNAEYIAAAAATTGKIVSFVQSGTEYRGVVSAVATSTNTIYGPTAYVVSFTFSGAAASYTLPAADGTPDISPVNLI